jgi:AcrR family transcriptional regulator
MPIHPPISQRAQQRETTRRQLVEAGLRVVATSGFAGTTTAAIAQATGKAHGTVFVHFPTRDALVAELIAEVGRTMSERLLSAETSAPSLSEVLNAHLVALADNEVLYSRLLCEASTLPLAARSMIFALQSGVASRIRTAYLRARKQGTMRKIDPVLLSNIWISLTNHYLMNRDLFAPDASVIAKCGADIKTQLLDLIRS